MSQTHHFWYLPNFYLYNIVDCNYEFLLGYALWVYTHVLIGLAWLETCLLQLVIVNHNISKVTNKLMKISFLNNEKTWFTKLAFHSRIYPLRMHVQTYRWPSWSDTHSRQHLDYHLISFSHTHTPSFSFIYGFNYHCFNYYILISNDLCHW